MNDSPESAKRDGLLPMFRNAHDLAAYNDRASKTRRLNDGRSQMSNHTMRTPPKGGSKRTLRRMDQIEEQENDDSIQS